MINTNVQFQNEKINVLIYIATLKLFEGHVRKV